MPLTHDDIRQLVSRQDDAALRILAEAATVGDEFLRRTAIEVIGSHSRGRSLQEDVCAALNDASGYVARTACEVIAQWRLPEAHDLVLPLLADAAGATRQVAVRTVNSIWSGSDFELIFDIYMKDPEIDVRKECAWVLRRHATSQNWQTLFDTFRGDELARHRQWACELAEAHSSAEALQPLSKLALDLDGHVRTAALRAISAISGNDRQKTL